MEEQMIGEAVIQDVIQVDVMAAAGFTPFPPVLLNSDQHRVLVTQLCNMIRKVGDRVKNDEGLQSAIDAVARCEDSRWERFLGVTDKVLKQEITWDRIAVLIYVAGKLAGKLARKLAIEVAESRLPQPVKNVLEWTKDFFRTNLLDWIIDHGGWISGLSELAKASVSAVASVTPSSYRLVLFFTLGMALGGFITWGAIKRRQTY